MYTAIDFSQSQRYIKDPDRSWQSSIVFLKNDKQAHEQHQQGGGALNLAVQVTTLFPSCFCVRKDFKYKKKEIHSNMICSYKFLQT